MSEILTPVSFGELLDKISILQIKSERMTDAAKLVNVRKDKVSCGMEIRGISESPVIGTLLKSECRSAAPGSRLHQIGCPAFQKPADVLVTNHQVIFIQPLVEPRGSGLDFGDALGAPNLIPRNEVAGSGGPHDLNELKCGYQADRR